MSDEQKQGDKRSIGRLTVDVRSDGSVHAAVMTDALAIESTVTVLDGNRIRFGAEDARTFLSACLAMLDEHIRERSIRRAMEH